MSGRPLRLLAFGISWPPETFLQRKLCGLAEAGMNVTAAVRSKHRPSERHLPGVRIMTMGALGDSVLAAIREPRRAARAAVDGLRLGSGPWKKRARRVRNVAPFLAMQPDVVHFEWNSAAIDYLPFLRTWHVPVVISCRGTQIMVRPHIDPDYAVLLRRTFEAADAVHCVCDAIREEAVSFGLDPAKAVVIRPAVNVSEFSPNRHDDEATLHVVAVGVLNWRKGYEYALTIVRRALDHGVRIRLSVAGEGEEAPRLRQAIVDLGLGANVTLRGGMPSAAVRDLLRTGDVFLHTSLGEGLSNAVLEAMACGLPIVTTDAGGMREAVTDGHEGFVISLRDVDGAVRALTALAADPDMRQRMGANARATAVARFSLADQIAAFRSLYERLAATALCPAR